jgi:hypothetical protein
MFRQTAYSFTKVVEYRRNINTTVGLTRSGNKVALWELNKRLSPLGIFFI